MAEDTTSASEKEQAVPTPVPEAAPAIESTEPTHATEVTPSTAPAATTAVTPVNVPTQNPIPTPGTNGLAIASMVAGIIAVISGWIPLWGLLVSAAAIVLGIIGVKKAHGKGMAIAGIVTGGVGALWAIAATTLFVFAIIASVNVAERARETSIERERDSQALIDGKKDFAKGETAILGNQFETKVNSVQRNYNPGASYVPGEGKEYIVVNITIKNVGESRKYTTISDYKVNDGSENPLRFSNVPVTDELKSTSIEPDGSITGNLAYLVTKDAAKLSLQYQTSVLDAEYKSQKLTYTIAL